MFYLISYESVTNLHKGTAPTEFFPQQEAQAIAHQPRPSPDRCQAYEAEGIRHDIVCFPKETWITTGVNPAVANP
jgi:hypothetical protein